MTRRLRRTAAACLFAALGAQAAGERLVTVQAHQFTGGSGLEDSMWSALYAAKSGKLYIGLCTHAEIGRASCRERV